MNLGRTFLVLAHFFLMAAGLGLAGCTGAGQRNLSNAIVVTSTPSLAECETKLVLELRDARDEVALGDVEAFLASDRAAGLSRANRSKAGFVRASCSTSRRTMRINAFAPAAETAAATHA